MQAISLQAYLSRPLSRAFHLFWILKHNHDLAMSQIIPPLLRLEDLQRSARWREKKEAQGWDFHPKDKPAGRLRNKPCGMCGKKNKRCTCYE